MRFRIHLLLLSGLVVAMSFPGCQGNPSTPGTDLDVNPSQVQPAVSEQPHHCLGYYWLVADTRRMAVEVQAARSADWHVNVTGILNSTMGVSAVGVPSQSDPANGLFVFDVTLAHPFPIKPQLAGFDVKGILITPGTMTGIEDLVFADVDETHLENADGWTRWWNPAEFIESGIFGYTQGNLANAGPSVLTATVNPYKCFADVLAAEETADKLYSVPLDDDLGRGVFRAGSSNTRRYRIRFPLNPGPVVRYGYAVDASWKAPNPNPPTQIPDDFPIEANQPEAYFTWMTQPANSLYFDTETGHGGGSLWVAAGLHDWQGELSGNAAAEVEAVNLWCPALFSGPIAMDFIADYSGEVVYYKKLWTELNPTQPGEYVLAMQAISKNGPTYKQGTQPAPNDNVSTWQVRKVVVTNPECVADDNNDAATAEPTAPYVGSSGSLCFTEDPIDWFRLMVPANHEASGTVWFKHDAGMQSLYMYDSKQTLIATGTQYDGYSEIKWDNTHLYAGIYYISVKLISDVGAIMYTVEPDLDITDITPTPTQVETKYLDCDAQWIHIVDDSHTLLAGYAGTWMMSPYAIARTYDWITTVPAYSNLHMYYWENLEDNPAGIDMVDYTSMSMPVEYEDVLVIPNTVEAITMNSQYLYVAVDDGVNTNIEIYDWASDPANPQLINTFQAYYKDINKMDIIDPEGANTTLVALTYHATTLYNIENPNSPSLIDYQTNLAYYNNNVSVSRSLGGGKAFVAVSSFDLDGNGHLAVYQYDTSTHDFPVWGTIDLPSSAASVMVKGSIVYIGDGDGITIIDIAVYDDFHNTGTTDTLSGSGMMDYSGNVLQSINYSAGFSIYNNADPYNPVETERPLFLNYPRDCSIYEDYGFFAEVIGFNYVGALKVVDINPLESASVVREHVLYGTPTSLFLESNRLVVGSAGPGHIWLYDVSDPLNCQQVYDKGFSVGVSAVCIAGIAMYATTTDGILKVFNISNFPNVTQKPDVDLPCSAVASKIVHHNHRLYISRQSTDEIWIYDISDMNNPTYVGLYYCGWQISDMDFGTYFWSDYLYVATQDRLVILDVSNPDDPIQKDAIQVPYALRHIAVDQQLAYVCGQKESPAVAAVFPPDDAKFVSVSFPDNPGFFNMGLSVAQGHLFEMQDCIGFTAFDLYP